MFDLDDVYTLESDDDATLDDVHAALQRAINSGSAWSFQGSYGRSMMEAIEDGACMLGRNPARDYYGNLIPSRDMVQPGTKGSFDYVVEHYGLEHAEAMAALD